MKRRTTARRCARIWINCRWGPGSRAIVRHDLVGSRRAIGENGVNAGILEHLSYRDFKQYWQA